MIEPGEKRGYKMWGKKFVKKKFTFAGDKEIEKIITTQPDPDYVNCPQCNGDGHKNYNEKCKHCLGFGKVDWLEYIVGRKPEHNTLENINHKMLLNQIQKAFNSMYLGSDNLTFKEQTEKFVIQAEAYLKDIVSRNGLYDYNIVSDPNLNKVDIYLKMSPGKDYIIYTIKINETI